MDTDTRIQQILLVIEDSDIDWLLLSTFFNSSIFQTHFELHRETSFAGATSFYTQNAAHIAAIITDNHFYDETSKSNNADAGLKFATLVRAQNSQLPIVLISSSPEYVPKDKIEQLAPFLCTAKTDFGPNMVARLIKVGVEYESDTAPGALSKHVVGGPTPSP